MLGCPLATPSDTLWFMQESERNGQRFYLAGILSLGLHILAVAGIGLYQFWQQTESPLAMDMGMPDLPINVQLITQSSQAAAQLPEPKPVAESTVIDTTAESLLKTAAKPQKIVEKKVAPQKTRPESKQEALSQNSLGEAEANSRASTTQKSEQVGINKTVTVTSKPRFRTQPQQPEYPMQARKRRQQGMVLVNITVEPNGKTSHVSIARSSGFPLLDNAALKAVKKWELFPHEINHQPVRATFQVPVEFELKR